MKREKYNTRSKNSVLEEVKCFNKDFTAKDIKDSLDNKNINIGLTTIYRELNELEEKNIIKKYYNDNNTAHYEYLCSCENDNHFYLKCMKCGMTKHVDCDCINEFSSHILREHNFNLNNNNLFISGICDECLRSEEK